MYLPVSTPAESGAQLPAGDMARFDAALYDDTLLSEASRERMFTPTDPRDHGIGWRVFEREYPGVDHLVTTTWHGGGHAGFASFAQRFFEDRFYLVLLGNTNGMRRPNDIRGAISDDLIRIFYGMPWELPVSTTGRPTWRPSTRSMRALTPTA